MNPSENKNNPQSSGWKGLGLAGWCAVGAITITTVIAAQSGWAVIEALRTPAPKPGDELDDGSKQTAEFRAGFKPRLAQIDGRSMFIVPAVGMLKVEETVVVEETPTKPTSYGGPKVVAMVFDAVWFDDGKKLNVGESADGGDLKVIKVTPPWDAVLEWKGVEFTVNFFERDKVVFKEEPKPDATPEPPPEALKPETPKTEDAKPAEPTPAEPKPTEPQPADPKPEAPAPSPVQPPAQQTAPSDQPKATR